MNKLLMGLFATALAMLGQPARADDALIARGKYLVALGGCEDCHTPGSFLGHRDATKVLGGSDVGFSVPGLGVFVPPNLTPDKETGLGNWTDAQIVAAITKGETPDGRILAPSMPYEDLKVLKPADSAAIVAYLRSLPPVQHKVGGSFGAGQPVNVFVMDVLPPPVHNSLPPLSAQSG